MAGLTRSVRWILIQIVREVAERDCRAVVLDLLAAHRHAYREVLALHETGRDVLRVQIAQDSYFLCRDELGGAVPGFISWPIFKVAHYLTVSLTSYRYHY